MAKGAVRVVTHAFVRPGRSHDFVRHLNCVTPAFVKAMLDVYGSVEGVPVSGLGEQERADALARLQRVAAC